MYKTLISIRTATGRSRFTPNFFGNIERCFCSTFPKQGSSPPNVPEKDSKNSSQQIQSKEKYDPKNVTKEDMKWRTPWHELEGQYYSMLRSFYSENSHVSLLKLLHSKPDLSPTAIKKWWAEKQKQKAIIMQSYIPARNQILGNELAAAHFLVHRGAAIKFHNDDKWVKANKNGEYNLPRHYQDNMYLEALDCSDMDLYYEGLVNLRGLSDVKWLSLNGCETIDDWCIDRISNIFSHSLVYLDLRNCQNISERGIGALYKMPHLKILYLDDFLRNTRYEMTCLLLQDANPALDVRSDGVKTF